MTTTRGNSHKCFQANTKSDTMCRVTPWIKRAMWLVVIYGILHLLISPLPELNAFSGKSMPDHYVFVTYFLLDLFFLTFFVTPGVPGPGRSLSISVLNKICLRL